MGTGQNNGFYIRKNVESFECPCNAVSHYLPGKMGHVNAVPGISLRIKNIG